MHRVLDLNVNETMRFHRRCGDRVTLLHDCSTAVRNFVEFNHGLILSEEPLQNDVMFEVCIDRKVNVWNGSLEIGVTTLDPEYTELPATATKLRNSAWIMSGNGVVKDGITFVSSYGPELDTLREGDCVGVSRTSKGELIFYVNGRSLGVAARGLPERVFAVIDLYGQCVQVSIVNNSAARRIMQPAMDPLEEELPMEEIQSANDGDEEVAGPSQTDSPPAEASGPAVETPVEVAEIIKLDRLRFHPRCGVLVKLLNNNKSAERARPLDDYNNGVVMTHRPLFENELFEIRIDRLVDKWSGSIEVGVTSHNPATIRFPSTMTNMDSGTVMMSGSKVLVNGHGNCLEYGNFNLDELREGDTVGMIRKPGNRLHYYINGVDQGCATDKVATHVWGVVDLYGMTVKVTIMDSYDILLNLPVTSSELDTPGPSSSVDFQAVDEDSLLFHQMRGTTVIVLGNYKTAHRVNAFELFDNGIVLSNRVLRPNELFQVRIDLIVQRWAGGIEIGITQSTDGLISPLVISTAKTGTYVLTGEDIVKEGVTIVPQYIQHIGRLVEGDTVGVMRKDNGALHFFVNGSDHGPAVQNVPEDVYGIVNLYGRVAQATIVDTAYAPPPAYSPESPISSESNATVYPDMCFHRVHGRNARLSHSRTTASRSNVTSEFNDAVLFSCRPLRECDMFEVRIDAMVDCWIGSLEIGVTAIKPEDLEANGGLEALAGTATDLNWDTYILSGAAMMKDGECVRSGYPLDLDTLTVGSKVGMMWHADRSLHYYLDGMDMGKAWYVPHLNVYAVVDLYGQCTQVTIQHNEERVFNCNSAGTNSDNSVVSNARPSSSPQAPYCFSEYCGDNVCLMHDYTIARRLTSDPMGGLIFSACHLTVGELYEIKIAEYKYGYAGGLRIGVTDINILNAHVNRILPPAIKHLPYYTAYIDGCYMKYSRPKCAEKDVFTVTPSFEWLRPGDRIGIQKLADGKVQVYYNCEPVDRLFEDVPDKVYVVMEIYGGIYKVQAIVKGHVSTSAGTPTPAPEDKATKNAVPIIHYTENRDEPESPTIVNWASLPFANGYDESVSSEPADCQDTDIRVANIADGIIEAPETTANDIPSEVPTTSGSPMPELEPSRSEESGESPILDFDEFDIPFPQRRRDNRQNINNDDNQIDNQTTYDHSSVGYSFDDFVATMSFTQEPLTRFQLNQEHRSRPYRMHNDYRNRAYQLTRDRFDPYTLACRYININEVPTGASFAYTMFAEANLLNELPSTSRLRVAVACEEDFMEPETLFDHHVSRDPPGQEGYHEYLPNDDLPIEEFVGEDEPESFIPDFDGTAETGTRAAGLQGLADFDFPFASYIPVWDIPTSSYSRHRQTADPRYDVETPNEVSTPSEQPTPTEMRSPCNTANEFPEITFEQANIAVAALEYANKTNSSNPDATNPLINTKSLDTTNPPDNTNLETNITPASLPLTNQPASPCRPDTADLSDAKEFNPYESDSDEVQLPLTAKESDTVDERDEIYESDDSGERKEILKYAKQSEYARSEKLREEDVFEVNNDTTEYRLYEVDDDIEINNDLCMYRLYEKKIDQYRTDTYDVYEKRDMEEDVYIDDYKEYSNEMIRLGESKDYKPTSLAIPSVHQVTPWMSDIDLEDSEPESGEAETSEEALTPEPREPPRPFTFYGICGRNIRLWCADTVATRTASYNNGIIAVPIPIYRGEKYMFRVDKTDGEWDGTVAIGAVAILPRVLPDTSLGLEPPCWVLTSELIYDGDDCYITDMGLDLEDLEELSTLTLHFRDNSDLEVELGGKVLGVIGTVEETREYVYPIIDLYGKTRQVSILLHPRSLLTSEKTPLETPVPKLKDIFDGEFLPLRQRSFSLGCPITKLDPILMRKTPDQEYSSRLPQTKNTPLIVHKSHSTNDFKKPARLNELRHARSTSSLDKRDDDEDSLDMLDALTLDGCNFPDLSEEQSSSYDDSTCPDDFWLEPMSMENLIYMNKLLCFDQDGTEGHLDVECELNRRDESRCEHLRMVLVYWNYLVLPYPEIRKIMSYGQAVCFCHKCVPEAAEPLAGWVRIERVDGIEGASRGYWHIGRSTIGAAQAVNTQKAEGRRPYSLTTTPNSESNISDVWFDEEGSPHQTVLVMEIDIVANEPQSDRIRAFLIFISTTRTRTPTPTEDRPEQLNLEHTNV